MSLLVATGHGCSCAYASTHRSLPVPPATKLYWLCSSTPPKTPSPYGSSVHINTVHDPLTARDCVLLSCTWPACPQPATGEIADPCDQTRTFLNSDLINCALGRLEPGPKLCPISRHGCQVDLICQGRAICIPFSQPLSRPAFWFYLQAAEHCIKHHGFNLFLAYPTPSLCRPKASDPVTVHCGEHSVHFCRGGLQLPLLHSALSKQSGTL